MRNGRTERIAALGILMVVMVSCDEEPCTDYCADERVLMHYEDGHALPVECPAFCRDGVCAGECVSGCRDGKTLVACADGAGRVEKCEGRCENGSCTAHAADGAWCLDGSRAISVRGGAEEIEVCQYGCTEGHCGESGEADPGEEERPEPGEEEEPSSGTCDPARCAGTCDRGICVTDAMRAYRAGDPCGSDFVQYCRGESRVYCNSLGEIVIGDCSDNGGCGVVFDSSGLNVWCNGPEGLCRHEGDELPYCRDHNGIPMKSRYVCARNTEGGMTALDRFYVGEYSLCDLGCSADESTCAEDVVSCPFVRKCHGEKLVSCKDFTTSGMDVVMTSEDCSASGRTCSVVAGVTGCYSSCDEAGAARYACVTDALGVESSIGTTCEQSGDVLYEVEKKRVCGRGCDAETGRCRVVYEEEGDLCLESSYESGCRGNIAVSCPFNYVMAMNCDTDYAEERTCATGPEGPTCLRSCTEAGAVTHECRYDPYYEGYIIIDTVCASHDGVLLADETATTFCFSGCNDAGTGCRYDEDGSCSPEVLLPHCDGNIAVSCYVRQGEGTVSAEDCSQYGERYTCGVVDGEARCVEKCAHLGDTRKVCSRIYGVGSVTQGYQCMYSQDKRQVYLETADYHGCANGCNDAGTECRGMEDGANKLE